MSAQFIIQLINAVIMNSSSSYQHKTLNKSTNMLILCLIYKMQSKTITFSRKSHRRQTSQKLAEQSPQIKKVRRITSQATTDLQLSPFDMVSWKQKLNYRPNESIQKLKFQNDIAMHIVARQKVRVMPKLPQRKICSNLMTHSLDYKPREQPKLVQQKIKFLTESQQSLFAQYNSPSAKVVFEEKHKELYLRIVRKAKQKEAKKVHSLKSYTQQLKRQIKEPSQQKLMQQNYFKTKYDEVNRRMEDIMKNWKKNKKSINERYYQLWVKPNSHKLNLKTVNVHQSQDFSGKTINIK